MHRHPLTSAQRAAYKRALQSSTRTEQVKARLLGSDEKGLPTPLHLSDSGGVVDTTQKDSAVETWLLTVYDPKKRFSTGSRTVRSDGKSWLAKYIQINVGIWVHDLNGDTGDWVWTPEFRGPIISIRRTEGVMVEIDLASKDIDLLPPAYFKRAFSVKRHTHIHKGVRAILRERGETRFRLRSTNKRLRKTRTWTRKGIPRKAIYELLKHTDDQFFYDGAGTPVTRRRPTKPVWVFRDEDFISYPEESLSRADLINEVVATGGSERKRQDGQKRPITAKAHLKAGHPLSAQSLSDGKRPLRLFRDFGNIKKRKELKERAKALVKRKAHLDQEVALSVRYIPGLEPGDVVKAAGRRIRLKRFTKAPNLSGSMEVNWVGSVVPKTRKGHR